MSHLALVQTIDSRSSSGSNFSFVPDWKSLAACWCHQSVVMGKQGKIRREISKREEMGGIFSLPDARNQVRSEKNSVALNKTNWIHITSILSPSPPPTILRAKWPGRKMAEWLWSSFYWWWKRGIWHTVISWNFALGVRFGYFPVRGHFYVWLVGVAIFNAVIYIYIYIYMYVYLWICKSVYIRVCVCRSCMCLYMEYIYT